MNRGMDLASLRKRVSDACRVLGNLDLTASTYGHVSARLPGTERVVIRARGPSESGVRFTTAEEVIEVDLDGRRVGSTDDGLAVPVEVFIHTEIYRRRADVYSVIHMHPASAVLVTACEVPLEPIFGAYDPFALSLALSGVPTYDRSILIDRPELGRELAETFDRSPACLMRGHGMTAVGNSIEEAALTAIQLDILATLSCQAHAIGSSRQISSKDQQYFAAMLTDYHKRNADCPPGVPPSALDPLWRYYQRRSCEEVKLSH